MAIELPQKQLNTQSSLGTGAVLSKKDVLERLPISESTLNRMINSKSFPTPIQIGTRKIGFIDIEVNEWIASRPRSRALEGSDDQ